ncbi:sulfatase-like hydrolase/transferase [uncultured Algibacter sp.]|uniref:sulfatase-like hydrolase/transferase n=1 Tax=uncultured Algibacter sp. TaxID=298659 RepID=UPI002622F657|nr:sulfatase-like hydrolase/transferase [uncultured Algibacter sp.]
MSGKFQILDSKRYYIIMLFFVVFVSCNTAKNKETSITGTNAVTEKPNIIFIYTDDQRQDALGVNGNEVIITPKIDEFSKESVQFSNANVVFALCSPSRAALLTGRYGSANGVLELGSNLNDNEVSVANYLKKIGYNTGVSGKWHLGQEPKDLGFDFSVIFHSNGAYYGRAIDDMGTQVKPEKHCDEYCVDRSIDFLKEAAKKEQPFFLYHNTQLPHMNGVLKWQAKQETLDKYNQEDMPVAASRNEDLSDKPKYLKKVRNLRQAKKYGYPDAEAIQKHTKEYYSVITEMDDALGRLFQTIDDLGLRKNTYIFFMSDNGWMLGDHGFTSKVLPYRPATRVPFFILGPDLKKGTNDRIVLNIDMAPTILELAGVEIPEDMHGTSMVPLLKGTAKNWREEFVYEGLGTYGGAKPNLTVISKDYRYIKTFENSELNATNFEELYSQEADYDEVKNIAKTEEGQEIIKKYNEAIANHKKEVLNK